MHGQYTRRKQRPLHANASKQPLAYLCGGLEVILLQERDRFLDLNFT